MKHQSDDVLKIADQLAKQKLSQIENPNYLDINVVLNTATVTTKEYLEDFNPESQSATMDNKHRGGNNTVKTNYRTTNIKCKKTTIFTKYQINLYILKHMVMQNCALLNLNLLY